VKSPKLMLSDSTATSRDISSSDCMPTGRVDEFGNLGWGIRGAFASSKSSSFTHVSEKCVGHVCCLLMESPIKVQI